MRTVSKIICIIPILSIYITFSQEEISPSIVKFLDKSIVQDIFFDGDTTWILCNKGLVKNFNDSTELFEIDTSSTDNLQNYLFRGSVNCPYHFMRQGESGKIWLATLATNYLMKIENGTIKNFGKSYNEKYNLMYMETDNEGNLWQLFLNNKLKEKYKLIKIDSDKKKEYNLPLADAILDFFIYKNTRCFIIRKADNYNYFVIIDDDNTPKYSKLFQSELFNSFTHYTTTSSIFLMDEAFNFCILDSNYNMKDKYSLGFPPQSYHFNFFIHNNNVYICNKNLVKYDLSKTSFTEISSKYLEQNCFYGYSKIYFSQDKKEIWCIYGDTMKKDCIIDKGDHVIPRIYKAGISIFKLSE